MAQALPQGEDRETWCREKLDFVCAVVSNVDRTSLKTQLEICETEEEAEALLQSLLWLQDSQQATGDDSEGAVAVLYDTGADVNEAQLVRPIPGAPELEPDMMWASWQVAGEDVEEYFDPIPMVQRNDPGTSGNLFYEDRLAVMVDENEDHFIRQVLERDTSAVVADNVLTRGMSEEINSPQRSEYSNDSVEVLDDNRDNHPELNELADSHEINSPRRSEYSNDSVEVLDDNGDNDPQVNEQADSHDNCMVIETGNISPADAQENFDDEREMHNNDDCRMSNIDEVAEDNNGVVLNDDRCAAPGIGKKAARRNEPDESRDKTVIDVGAEGGDSSVAGALHTSNVCSDVLQSGHINSNENWGTRRVAIEEPDYVVVDMKDGNVNTNDEHEDDGCAGNIRGEENAVDPGTSEGQDNTGNEGDDIQNEGMDTDLVSGEEDDISIIGVVPGVFVIEGFAPSDESDDNHVQLNVDQVSEHSEPTTAGEEENDDDEDEDESWYDPLQSSEEVQLPDKLNDALREQDNINRDEHLVRQILEDMAREEQERLEADERLARQIAEEMERQECLQEAQDERLARRLAEELNEEAGGVREDDDLARAEGGSQRQDGEVVALDSEEDIEDLSQETADDEMLARELAEEDTVADLEDTTGDEELARRLEEEENQNLQDPADENKSTQLAQLMSIFPDADPQYLLERCDDNVGFEQLVEELIELQKTNPRDPRISGHHKRQQEVRVGSTKRLRTDIPHSSRYGHEQGAAGSLTYECTICFEEDIPAQHMATCNSLRISHLFCIECVRKHVGAQIGLGNNIFRCMNGYCEAEFSLTTLGRVMEPVVLKKVQERRQQEEVERAGIENLVACPFCNFMVIMEDPQNRVLECLNPECLKESCRLCRRPSHIPLRCEEVEYDNQKDARVHIENKMSEAMIRTCPNCKKSIVSVGGCNKMTCPCGTVMCYVCKQAITNSYDHFTRGQCPQSSNLDELHTTNIREAASQARQEVDPQVNLLHDPTKGVL